MNKLNKDKNNINNDNAIIDNELNMNNNDNDNDLMNFKDNIK